MHQIRSGERVVSDFERDDLHREVQRTQGRLTQRVGYDLLGRRAWQSAGAAALAGAAIDAARQSARLYHFHTDLVGAPLEVTDEAGELAWAGKYTAWGKVEHGEDAALLARIEQPLRYPGQYADESTGLHYNTFRYYDPDVGRFISQDPIGLAGGENLYAYAPNPTGWMDPLGWACWSTERKNFWKAEARNNAAAYSPANLARITQGNAPQIKVEIFIRETRLVEIKNVSLELHHVTIPQRTGGQGVHSPGNLAKLTPWEHEAVDSFRHTGSDLIRIIENIGSW